MRKAPATPAALSVKPRFATRAVGMEEPMPVMQALMKKITMPVFHT